MPFAQRAAALTAAVALTAGGFAAEAVLHPRAAEAAPRPGPDTPSALVLAVDAPATGLRSTILICGPTSGPHPDAATACRNVASVNGDLDALEVEPGPCTMEHAPVTVHAWGFWQDRPVSYTKSFDNSCLLRRGTGTLFDF